MVDNSIFQYTSRKQIMISENITIWDKMSTAVFIVDASGVVVYMNKIQREMDGFTEFEVVGKHVTQLYRPNDILRLPTMECLRLGIPILKKRYVYRTINNLTYDSISDFFPLFDHGLRDGVLCFSSWPSISGTDNFGLETHSTLPKSRSGNDKRLLTSQKNHASHTTHYTFESILGNDPVLKKAIADAKTVAPSSTSVMIWGESGTGKELFAQSIHEASPRCGKPFIAVNCAAIPETILEGVLFGTVKGAYTDASDREGLFEKADGGTILLDELNSMPLGLQGKLLRVLQEKRVRRLGSHSENPIDVRIISILNESPLSAVEHGRLRDDLYYRLAVVGIHVPPLRDRLDDIPLLVKSFIDTISPYVHVDDEVMSLFRSYLWHGNVRELQHIIEGSLALLGNETIIMRSNLPQQFIEHIYYQSKKSEKIPVFQKDGFSYDIYDYRNIERGTFMPLKEKVKEYEFRCICNVLRVARGNISKAARILDLSGAGLHYKIKQLGITENDY